MAKIFKPKDLFKALTAEQRRIAQRNFKRAGSLKGKIKVKDNDVFNLKEG